MPSFSNRPSETRSGVLFMALSVLCFTANTLLLKYLGAVRGVDISLTLLVRALAGTVILFFFFNTRRPLDVRAAILEPKLILRGLIGLVGTAAYYWTVPVLGAGKATFLGTTYVLFGALFAALFLGERLSRTKTAWLLVAFAGIPLLTGAGSPGESLLGFSEGIALIGAVAAACVIVLIRQLVILHSNATIFFSQCFWIGIVIIPIAILRFENPGWIGAALLTAAGVAAAYGQICMVQGFRHLEVARGASIQMALPITASLGGVLLFAEVFTPLQLAGAALTLLGTWRLIVARG